MTPNSLYLGDNLLVLREDFADESVDLVYLDPPFNSKRDYNYVFRSEVGADDTAHVKAFSDTWSFEGAAAAYHELVLLGDPTSRVLEGLRAAFGETSLVGYLSVMALRLRELRRVLKPTGSLYLHCDPTASHYLKMVLDAVFGAGSFVSHVTWKRTSAHGNVGKRYAAVQDHLLFYARSAHWIWNQPHLPYSDDYIASHYSQPEPESGRRFTTRDLTASMQRASRGQIYEWRGLRPTESRCWAYTVDKMDQFAAEGRLWFSAGGFPRMKLYLDEMPGTPCDDIWVDIPPINSQAAERLGYPTQKPLALLERIVAASSNPGDLVLDPFCGCGTAVAAAQKLGRQWVGIDITPLAITLIRKRMMEHFPDDFPEPRSIPVHGLPVDVAGARMLAVQDRYAFEQWALQLLAAAPAGGGEMKGKGADRGIDGVITWFDGNDTPQRCLVSVKSGHVGFHHVHDLVGTVQREGAAMGVLVTLEHPTAPMLTKTAGAGQYRPEGLNTQKAFQRIQVVTVEQLLEGPGADLPRWRASPHKEARQIERDDQPRLDV